MINYLKGELVSKVENSPNGCNLTIEVNNIGYLVLTNKRVLASLPDVGETVKIYTSLMHREDAMYLCGFDNREDRDLFNILQSVSGIGVKVSLQMLEELGAHELVSAVIKEDAKALSRTKGVGPKLAQRIILELKDKMTSWREKVEFVAPAKLASTSKQTETSYLETESVLLSLGYSKEEASLSLEKAVSEATDPNNPEELLRIALQWLAGRE
mgnify:CR=1 FL=1